jgi:hypothetical protein
LIQIIFQGIKTRRPELAVLMICLRVGSAIAWNTSLLMEKETFWLQYKQNDQSIFAGWIISKSLPTS